MSTIVAVVVTHDRFALLKGCIASLRGQTRKPDRILVVANEPTKEIEHWLGEQADLTVFPQGNLGSAGGQHRGLKEAVALGADWIWCMDDDSDPTPNALEKLTRSPYFENKTAGFLASVVKWNDGSLHHMNLMNPRFVGEWLGDILETKSLPVTSCSFVGVMFNRIAVEACGYPISEMFIWGDDIEYTRRISHRFPCYGVLDSIVFHRTAENAGADSQIPENAPSPVKIRCLYRNNVTLHLLAPCPLPVRVKNAVVWVAKELLRTKTWKRRRDILLNSFRGIPFYLQSCRPYRLSKKSIA